MIPRAPKVTRVYQNHHLDSTRWDAFTPRDDDIVVATPYKSGTTWMQLIVQALLRGGQPTASLNEVSPWLDMRMSPIDEVIGKLEALSHRRSIKTHLPLDGLRFFPQIKYVVVGRDARDVFMSLWNHYSNYMPDFYEKINDNPGRVGVPLPICPDDIRQFWSGWISAGWFDWETEGYPFWSNMRHVQSWWDYRDIPNILFVHYNDLLADLEGEVLRVACFLDIEVPEEVLPRVVDSVTFGTVKQNAENIWPGMETSFRGGAQTFFHKGTNGRWKTVLTESDLKLYEAAVARELSAECAEWLEHAAAGEAE
ncbi:MAG: sulfotransferase domain-containing protein [Chloroflexi bacterium]|nr:sulfotransferase domain-containing protein [Chloroflexota bacterium]